MNIVKNLLLPFIIIALCVTNVFGQEDPLDKVAWKFHIEQDGCDATVIGTATIVDHWHVYGANLPEGSFTLPTELIVDDSPNYKKEGGVTEPKPEIVYDEIVEEDLYLHSGIVAFKQKITILSEKDFV